MKTKLVAMGLLVCWGCGGSAFEAFDATGGAAGESNTGGSGTTGGRAGSGGATSTGGTTMSTGGAISSGGQTSDGGTAMSTGGTTMNTGGTATNTGGTAHTGGTTMNTGGTAMNTGGTARGGTANTGGTAMNTGGTATNTGGTTMNTGGTTSTGGNKGSGGASGGSGGLGNLSCDELAQRYQTVLSQALVCEPTTPNPCSVSVQSSLFCGCKTFVSSQHQPQIDELTLIQKEASKRNCLVACPAIACIDPASANCQATASTGTATAHACKNVAGGIDI